MMMMMMTMMVRLLMPLLMLTEILPAAAASMFRVRALLSWSGRVVLKLARGNKAR